MRFRDRQRFVQGVSRTCKTARFPHRVEAGVFPDDEHSFPRRSRLCQLPFGTLSAKLRDDFPSRFNYWLTAEVNSLSLSIGSPLQCKASRQIAQTFVSELFISHPRLKFCIMSSVLAWSGTVELFIFLLFAFANTNKKHKRLIANCTSYALRFDSREMKY